MPVKYAVIGCGAIAQRRHLPEAAANPDCQLVGVTDINAPRTQEIAAKYHVPAFTDYRTMLKQTDADAVVVCTPNAFHSTHAIAALRAGKHVLCEKPMATTRPEAKAMIDAAKKSRKYLMVAMNQRFMAPHVKAKQILDSGRLGKVLSFRTAFQHGGPDRWSIDGPKSWFFKKDLAVLGTTGDLGVHKADLMRWLLGEEFVEVSAIIATQDKRTPDGKLIQLDDNAYLTLKTQSGIVGSLIASWTAYGAGENYTLLYCQNGVLSIGNHPDFGVVVSYKDRTQEFHKVAAMATNERQTRSGVIDAFTSCILNKKAPGIDGMEGYNSLAVILTAMESAKAGKRLRIK